MMTVVSQTAAMEHVMSMRGVDCVMVLLELPPVSAIQLM